jgi:uncharacterized membrane protein
MTDRESRRSLLLWGGTVGVGLGAMIDVILFHLVLQTHHLLSGLIDPYAIDGLRTNVMYDGLFMAGMLALTVAGGAMLWRLANGASEKLSSTALVGSILVGAGVFNVFDGVVNHYVLGLHNVVHGTEAWNPHWLVVSVLLLGAGLLVLRMAE